MIKFQSIEDLSEEDRLLVLRKYADLLVASCGLYLSLGAAKQEAKPTEALGLATRLIADASSNAAQKMADMPDDPNDPFYATTEAKQ